MSMLTPDLLDELLQRWQAQRAPVAERLQPGLAAADIDRLMEPLGLALPAEVRTWWGWRNGVAASSIRVTVDRSMGGPDFEFLPLDEAVALYRRRRQLAEQGAEPIPNAPETGEVDYWWEPGWFPLMTTRYGATIACDCSVEPNAPTVLREVDWHDEGFREPRGGSLRTMIEWWLDAIDRGAWRYDSDERRWLLNYSRLEDPTRELTRLV
jgi:cell wall assembly regulator SMI1